MPSAEEDAANDTATLTECARFDWVVFGASDRLHNAAEFVVDVDEWCFRDVRTACGLRQERAFIPGILTRMGAARCSHCCDRLGYPRGKGSPKNDDGCRALLGLSTRPIPPENDAWQIALDFACDRLPCWLQRGHDGPCEPGSRLDPRRPIPPGGDPTTDHGVYRCECETDAHEKPHTRVFPPVDDRDPKPCPRCGEVCTYDGWGHVHANGVGIGSCPIPPGATP